MPGPAPGWTCTRVGAVKYDRPKKKWTVRDMIRLARKIDLTRAQFEQVMTELLLRIPEEERPAEFAGENGFGGGGATRPVPKE